jgi:hypothetical protein
MSEIDTERAPSERPTRGPAMKKKKTGKVASAAAAVATNEGCIIGAMNKAEIARRGRVHILISA